MHKYLIVSATNKTLTIGNFPKLVEFWRSKKKGCSRVNRLNARAVLFCHESDLDTIQDMFPSLFDSEAKVALFEISGCAHKLQGVAKSQLEEFCDA
jgi:hypothetical protein